LSDELARGFDFAENGSGNFSPMPSSRAADLSSVGWMGAVACGAFRLLDEHVAEIKRITAVQISRDPAGGSCDFLGILDEIGQGRKQVPGSCCPD
jgi:hypothetical protein